MRLALNGWPPLASHTAALLVGGAIAGFNRPQAERSPPLAPRSLVVSLTPELVTAALKEAGLTSSAPDLRKLTWSFVRREHAAMPRCRLGRGSWHINDAKRGALLGSMDLAGEFASALPLLRKRNVILMPIEQASALPACAATPKVIYGAP